MKPAGAIALFVLGITGVVMYFMLGRPDPAVKRVSLYTSSRWESAGDAALFTASQQRLPDGISFSPNQFIIDFPLRSDSASAGLPKLPEALADFRKWSEAQVKLDFISLSCRNELDIRPEGVQIDTAAWWRRLLEVCDTLLLAAPKTGGLIIGHDAAAMDPKGTFWCSFYTQLKEKRQVTPSLSFHADQIEHIPYPECNGVLAVIYPVLAQDADYNYCREWNFAIAAKAESLVKPVLIWKMNLIKEDLWNKFSHRLSHWPQQVKMTGANFNTIYPKVPFSDTTSYYALSQQAEFLKELRKYMQP